MDLRPGEKRGSRVKGLDEESNQAARHIDQEYSGVNNPGTRKKACYGSADFPPVVPIETKDWMIFVATCVRRRDPRVARCSRSVDFGFSGMGQATRGCKFCHDFMHSGPACSQVFCYCAKGISRSSSLVIVPLLAVVLAMVGDRC